MTFARNLQERVSPAHAGVKGPCTCVPTWVTRQPRVCGGSHGPAAEAVLGRPPVRALGSAAETTQDLAESSPLAAQCPRC